MSCLNTLVQGNITDIDAKFDIHSVEERSQFKDDLLQLLQDHQGQRSWFSRLTGLITFKNIILILMTLVGIVFVVALCKDILFMLGKAFGDMIIYLLTSKYLMYTLGYGLSGVCFFKPQFIPWNFFEQFYPLFGLLLFSVTLFFTFVDVIKEDVFEEYFYFLNAIWILASLYSQISFIGTLTVVLSFYNAGFVIGSYHGRGVQSGYNSRKNLYRCLFLSMTLNACLIYTKITQIPLGPFGVFEIGIEFWGTLAGTIAALIASSDFYLRSRFYNNRDKENYFLKFWASKLPFAVYCLFLMYTGTVFNVNSYANIGGTFLFFSALDIEYYVLQEFKSESLTGITLIILINLYILKELITHYPEYFLFMS